MSFHGKSIGDGLLGKLARATKVQIGSAYFRPDDSLMDALISVTSVEQLISEEFTINNPYELRQLKKADIRSIPPS